jgi:hypothetical protein
VRLYNGTIQIDKEFTRHRPFLPAFGFPDNLGREILEKCAEGQQLDGIK